MPKDYIGKFANRVLMPGEEGYNDPSFPWGGVRNVTGWKKPDAVRLHITGFFLLDKRMNPPIAVFKNATIVGNTRRVMLDELQPFQSLDEALHHKQKMNLSMDDERRVVPVALAPDPGMGNPQPNVIWVDRKTAKSM